MTNITHDHRATSQKDLTAVQVLLLGLNLGPSAPESDMLTTQLDRTE